MRPAREVFDTARVRFECGHEGSVSSGAIYKVRCRSGRREELVRAAPGAELSIGAVPEQHDPARASRSQGHAQNLPTCQEAITLSRAGPSIKGEVAKK